MSLVDRAKALELTDLAQTCFDAGCADDALAHAQSALRHDPDSFAARLLEARLHVALQKPAEAMRSLDALALSQPQAMIRPDVALLRAEALAAGGQSDFAIDHLLALARRFPDDVRPPRLMATIHLQRRDSAKALAALQEVARLEPANIGVKRMLAMLTAAVAPQHAADAMVNLPPFAQEDGATLAAAHWFARAGRKADARALLDELLARHPHDVTLAIAAGELADRIGDHTGAIARLSTATGKPGPHRPRALVALAKAFMHVGRFAEAITYWFRLTRLSQRDTRAWSALAVCAAMIDRHGLMKRALRRGRNAEEKLNAHRAVHFIAENWMRCVAPRVAREVQADRPAAPPQDAPLTALLRRSLSTLKETSRSHPDWADTHYHAAACHAALGERSQAQEEVQAALDINPHYRAAVTLAGMLSHQSKLAA